ncbi:MAG: hypothetical protein CR993_02780 [Rhodobacterales bacterium]|nr:MAG: hypothetical protein CR993_02780 [Rhodobacterales bacterium]
MQARFEAGSGTELAILLPGLRYGCERPLLSGAAEVFRHRGCDIARLNFTYSEDTEFLQTDDETQLAQIASDGRDILQYLMQLRRYERIWVIGKSLGTIAMGAAFADRKLAARNVYGIWLTPSLTGTPLPKQLMAQDYPGVVVIGTEDPSYVTELMAPLEAQPNIHVCPIAGADHGFDHVKRNRFNLQHRASKFAFEISRMLMERQRILIHI